MEDIDEGIVPPKSMEEEEFRPYFPHKIEEEGVLTKFGLKKKLVKVGEGWEAPEQGDEITVNYTATVLGGVQFASSADKGEPLVVAIGKENILKGCKEGIITMRKGEISIFTVPPELTQGIQNLYPDIPLDATLQFEVELLFWFKVVDVCNDGGILKKILYRSEVFERAEKKDEVTVKYEVKLEDGRVVAKSPEDGVEFLVNDGHLCPAIAKAVVTMRKEEKVILRAEPQYAFGNIGRPAQDGLSAVPPNAVVNISLELVSYKLLEYITDDMLVIKKITTPGVGFEKPNSGTTAQIKYIAKLSDGTIFDKKGYDGEDPLEFKVDEEQIIEGLDMAVATMKRGEFAQVIINHEYGFGETETKTKFAVVPARSILYYDVEVVGFTKVTESWDMEAAQKLEYAAKRKEQGNAYFKDGKYKRASLRYDMAAKYVEFDSTFTEEQKKAGNFFKVSCNLNNASCKLKLKEFREAATLCSKVLKLEPSNIKALFRRAQAYMETTDLDLAELDLKKALVIDADNGEVKQQLQRLKNLKSYYDKKDSTLYANMMKKMKV
ncbi:Peptidyl-prolyl cis-trans isomerase [Macleaya cordata]|uniref:peptidylprolyl isomerase n=1 Tax=Macleaya cordata TaxID=56857 RepID=A0A200RCA8_MACCD|nr:Peptidyl-prolyl cis-trans isomerase [Macleaya cordata]